MTPGTQWVFGVASNKFPGDDRKDLKCVCNEVPAPGQSSRENCIRLESRGNRSRLPQTPAEKGSRIFFRLTNGRRRGNRNQKPISTSRKGGKPIHGSHAANRLCAKTYHRPDMSARLPLHMLVSFNRRFHMTRNPAVLISEYPQYPRAHHPLFLAVMWWHH